MWFDGGGEFGYGNIRRSVELGKVLAGRGHSVDFVPLSPRASALCPVPPATGGVADAVVLDVPYCGDEAVRRARETGARVAALDFDGIEPPDLVVSLQAVRRVPAQSRFLCGVEYAIIRGEIRLLGTRHETGDEALVIVGGGDQDGLTTRIIERLPDLPVCVVQGPAGAPLRFDRANVRVVENPPDLPRLMARCAWAVSTGGTTMLELLSLGKAVHVVPRTEAETIFAGRFDSAGALLGIGLDRLRAPSPEAVAACELRGPQLVDGRGCERIAVEVEALI